MGHCPGSPTGYHYLSLSIIPYIQCIYQGISWFLFRAIRLLVKLWIVSSFNKWSNINVTASKNLLDFILPSLTSVSGLDLSYWVYIFFNDLPKMRIWNFVEFLHHAMSYNIRVLIQNQTTDWILSKFCVLVLRRYRGTPCYCWKHFIVFNIWLPLIVDHNWFG